MKVKALTKVWYGGTEWLPGAEFDYDDGADLRAAIAVGTVKPAEEEYQVQPAQKEPPWSGQ